MGPGLKEMFIRVTAPLYRWRDRSMRKEALELYAAHGAAAVALLREKIGACARYEERKRLYRLHDEIARRLPRPG